MIQSIEYNSKDKSFSLRDIGYNEAINRERDKRHNIQHRVNKAELKLQDRSWFKSKLNNAPVLALGTRTRNWASGTGFKGDVRANKLARLNAKQGRSQAREDYNEKSKNINHNAPEHVTMDAD